MWGLVFSLIGCLYVLVEERLNVPILLCQMFGIFFLTSALFASCVMWNSLRRLHEKVLSAGIPLFLKDNRLHIAFVLLFAFTIYSLVGDLSSKIGFLLWLIGFGISFDLFSFFFTRIKHYSDPLFVLEKLPSQVMHSLQKKEEKAALDWMNFVFETIDKAIETHKFTLANRALDTSRLCFEEYVRQLARIELLTIEPSFLDKVNLVSIMVCEKLQWLYTRARKKEMTPTVQAISLSFGKLCLFLSKHHTKAAALPLQYLVKCAEVGDEEELIQATLTLGQACKSLLNLSLEKRESFKELIISSLFNMEKMVKQIYTRNKESNVALLIQPFAEVAESLGSEGLQEVLNRAEILAELKRIFTQFESLQMVSSGISEIVSQDTSSSFAQDVIKS